MLLCGEKLPEFMRCMNSIFRGHDMRFAWIDRQAPSIFARCLSLIGNPRYKCPYHSRLPTVLISWTTPCQAQTPMRIILAWPPMCLDFAQISDNIRLVKDCHAANFTCIGLPGTALTQPL